MGDGAWGKGKTCLRLRRCSELGGMGRLKMGDRSRFQCGFPSLK